MLLERYDFDGVKAHTTGVDPLVVTTENARKAVFEKLHRSGAAQSGNRAKRITRRGLMVRGNSFVGQRYGQRVVVKIRYVKHKSGKAGAGGGATTLRDHLRYISRSGAGKDGDQAVLFNGQDEGLARADFYALCKDDRHHFRFIISPENGHGIPDFHAYVRDVMALVGKDLGTTLEWRSAVHYDTEDPHAHVIVRGKTDRGEDLVIGRDYIKEGVRKRAQEVATALLGERSMEDIQKSQERDVDALRVTSLDRFIAKQAVAGQGQIDVRNRISFDKSLFYERLVKNRLRFLAQTGLAHENPSGVYSLKADYHDVLSQIADRNDAMKRIHGKVDIGLEGIAVYALKAGTGPTIEGKIIAKGVEDELYERKFIVVKDTTGPLHYVPVGDLRQYDELENGSLINIRPGEAGTGKADYNIAAIASAHGGVYDPAHHKAYIEEHQRYIKAEERAKYLEAHTIRLDALEKNDVVVALGQGRYNVPADVIKLGEDVTRQINEREKKRFYPIVSVLSAIPPERQVDASKKTWLDKELYKQSIGKPVSVIIHDPIVKTALEERKNWLVKHDLAIIQSNGDFALRDHALSKLDKMEIYASGRKLADKIGATFNDARVATDTVMHYEGFVTLETGIWAAVTKGKTLQMAPLKADPKLERGVQVLFEAGADQVLSIKALGKQQDKSRDQEQGRDL